MKCADPNKYVQLLCTNPCPFNKILKPHKLPLCRSFNQDPFCSFLFQVLYMDKTGIYHFTLYSGQIFSLVYTWGKDFRTCSFEFMKVKFSVIKPSEVVDYGNHKLHGEICLQVQALITLYSKRSGMCLGKRIASKTFHLSPYFSCDLLRIILFPAVSKKLLFDNVELVV